MPLKWRNSSENNGVEGKPGRKSIFRLCVIVSIGATAVMRVMDGSDLRQLILEVGHLHLVKSIAMTYDDMTAVNAEHHEWLQGLDFYLEDLRFQERRLLELAGNLPDIQMSRSIEHFQNQFIIQHNNIDELRHAIREHISGFGHSVARGDGTLKGEHSLTHQELKDGYLSFEKVMNELRHEFGVFLSHGHA